MSYMVKKTTLNISCLNKGHYKDERQSNLSCLCPCYKDCFPENRGRLSAEKAFPKWRSFGKIYFH